MMRSIVCCTLLFLVAPVFASDAAASPFERQILHEGIWLFHVPSDSRTHTNSLVFELDSGLLVVESQPSPEAAGDLLRAIGAVSDLPIAFLVIGHAAVSSSGGASAFPESTVVIASGPTQEALLDENRDLSGDVRLRSLDPENWKAPPRTPAELVVGGITSFTSRRFVVDLLPIAAAHYPGMIVVRIEDLGLYYVGNMVVNDRNPYADIEHSNVYAWISWVNSLVLLKPETIVPSRGLALNETDLRSFRNALGWIVFQVEGAFGDHVPEAEIVDVAMDKPKLSEYFDLDADPSLVWTVFERCKRDGLFQRQKRGVSYEEERRKGR